MLPPGKTGALGHRVASGLDDLAGFDRSDCDAEQQRVLDLIENIGETVPVTWLGETPESVAMLAGTVVAPEQFDAASRNDVNRQEIERAEAQLKQTRLLWCGWLAAPG